MRNLLRLAGWNLAMARRACGAACALFAAQQLLVLLALAASKASVGRGYYELYMDGLQFLAFPVLFVAVGALAVRPLSPANGRAMAGCTLLTLPLPRSLLLAGNVLACLVAQLGAAAGQVALYFLYYWPVRLVSAQVEAGLIQTPVQPQLFHEQLARNPVIMALLPTSPARAAVLALLLGATALVTACVATHRGPRRIAALLLAGAAAACCVAAARAWRSLAQGAASGGLFGLALAALVLLVLVQLAWALWALHRAELLQ